MSQFRVSKELAVQIQVNSTTLLDEEYFDSSVEDVPSVQNEIGNRLQALLGTLQSIQHATSPGELTVIETRSEGEKKQYVFSKSVEEAVTSRLGLNLADPTVIALIHALATELMQWAQQTETEFIFQDDRLKLESKDRHAPISGAKWSDAGS